MKVEDLLSCALQVLGRATLRPDRIRRTIGSRKKQLRAFNLCDGSNTVRQIARKARLDEGNLSRTLSRWREHGIVFLVGEGKQARFLHIYALPERDIPPD
jgi:hypothetical protein